MILTDETDFEDIEIGPLLRDGTCTIGGVKATFIRRAGERLVISFSQNDNETSWLTDVCAEEDFSELRFTAQTAEAFSSPRVASMLASLAKEQSFAGTQISLCANGECCDHALSSGVVFKEPVIVLFDPSNLSSPTPAVVFFDPFVMTGHQIPKHGQWLKCFGSNGESAATLARMHLHRSVLSAALQGELEQTHFYAQLRKRKDYRFYRIGVEKALKARGKARLIPHFRDLFRARRIAQTREIDALQTRAAEARPASPGAWARFRPDNTLSPSEGGNAWMLRSEDGRLRYLSDRWQGVTMGYVEQDGITLAETPGIAIGIAAFGDGQHVERPLTRRFPWHVVDARLDGTGPAFGPTAEATLSLEQLHAEHAGLVTAITLGTAQPGITADEALPGAQQYRDTIAQIEAACSALVAWEKALVVDRLRLSLLTGALDTREADAAAHYQKVAHAFSRDIQAITGQAFPPSIVVVPNAGHRRDGTSEVSLAEARFELDNPTLDVVIPTPSYPFALMDEMPATHSPEAALLMDELCMLAIRARQNGKPWHCPQLQFAEISGTTMTAQFSTMDGLLLEDGAHGFHVVGEDAPSITHVEVTSDTEVTIELDAAIERTDLQLAYSWGHKSDRDDSLHAANHGALRDRWTQKSSAVEGHVLHRFALPARVPLHMKN